MFHILDLPLMDEESFYIYVHVYFSRSPENKQAFETDFIDVSSHLSFHHCKQAKPFIQ